MRYYNLQILGLGKKYVLDEKNPWGLDVVFTIQSSMSVSQALPSTFEILNGDITLFSNTQELKGKQVIFNAGIKNAPYLKNQQISPTTNLLPLFFAQIDASFASWEFTENRCVMAFSSSRPMASDNTFVMKKGDIVAKVVAEFLIKNLTRNGYKAPVIVEENALNTVFNNNSSIPFQFNGDKRSSNDLIQKIAQFLKQFNLDIKYKANVNEYRIYSTKEQLINLFSLSPPVLLHPTSLLSQPVWEDASKVTLEMALDPRVVLGSKLFLPTNLELFSNNTGFGNILLKSAMDARIIKNGYYDVIEVMHIGDSRNTDTKAWSTVCKCVFSI